MSIEQIFSDLQFSNLIWQIVTPLIFSLADILTGYIQAIIHKNVQSQVMREGLLHKSLLIIVLVLGFIIQFAFNLTYVSVAICLYICIMEITSILENLKKAGIDLKLADFLKGDDESEEK